MNRRKLDSFKIFISQERKIAESCNLVSMEKISKLKNLCSGFSKFCFGAEILSPKNQVAYLILQVAYLVRNFLKNDVQPALYHLTELQKKTWKIWYLTWTEFWKSPAKERAKQYFWQTKVKGFSRVILKAVLWIRIRSGPYHLAGSR